MSKRKQRVYIDSESGKEIPLYELINSYKELIHEGELDLEISFPEWLNATVNDKNSFVDMEER